MLKMWDKKGVDVFKLFVYILLRRQPLANEKGYRVNVIGGNIMFNIFRKKSMVERATDSACNASKTAAKVVGTAVVGTLYGIGAIAVAMGEAAAAAEARKAEARKEAREAREAADAAERKAREAEARAYGYRAAADATVETKRRYTSCNGRIYEVLRKYKGMCEYTVEVRRYSDGRLVRVEDMFGLAAAISCEKVFSDEIRRGYLD